MPSRSGYASFCAEAPSLAPYTFIPSLMPSSFLSVYAQEDKLNRQLLTSFEEARLEMATRRSGRRRQQNAEERLRVTRAAAAIERAINSGDMRLPQSDWDAPRTVTPGSHEAPPPAGASMNQGPSNQERSDDLITNCAYDTRIRSLRPTKPTKAKTAKKVFNTAYHNERKFLRVSMAMREE